MESDTITFDKINRRQRIIYCLLGFRGISMLLIIGALSMGNSCCDDVLGFYPWLILMLFVYLLAISHDVYRLRKFARGTTYTNICLRVSMLLVILLMILWGFIALVAYYSNSSDAHQYYHDREDKNLPFVVSFIYWPLVICSGAQLAFYAASKLRDHV